jgi:5-methylcytosine-specific restriction protein A
MSIGLRHALSVVLDGYLAATQSEFSGHSIAKHLRKNLPAAIQAIMGSNERYKIEGSAGQGNWAKVPWVAVFDRLITESAQDGYYLVYLFRQDCTGVYLSLNQGVMSTKREYGAETRRALSTRAADYVARLGHLADRLQQGEIDLGASSSSSLGGFYENGSICARYYRADLLPSEENLIADLIHFTDLYFSLASRDSRLYKQADAEDDEFGLSDEDVRTLREHKRIERNTVLVARAKRFHGYKCKACGFNFEEKYGSIGQEFIEAHHLTPLKLLKGKVLTLDPRTDFTVLCSNCHRMIHRSEFTSRVEDFRSKYLASSK